MRLENSQSLMYDILSLFEDVNGLSNSFTNTNRFIFEKTSLSMPKFSPPELGFYSTVSWFYVVYFEIAKVHIEFLSDKFTAYGLDESGQFTEHVSNVKYLRTYLQHNLNQNKVRDIKIFSHCHLWLHSTCGTTVPEDEDWTKCLKAFLIEIKGFLNLLKETHHF